MLIAQADEHFHDAADDRAPTADTALITALRSGDEAAFRSLIEHYHQSLLRVARLYVSNLSVAEEVVQETWLGVLQGLGRFEGRSSLKTWIFRILTNRAKTRAAREGRSVPFSTLGSLETDTDEPTVDPDRFLPVNHAQWPGHWASFPKSWAALPEERFLAQETRKQIAAAIKALPTAQQTVITLRDVSGWSADEVCNALAISETNQRVLLHRARAKVRRTLEQYFEGA